MSRKDSRYLTLRKLLDDTPLLISRWRCNLEIPIAECTLPDSLFCFFKGKKDTCHTFGQVWVGKGCPKEMPSGWWYQTIQHTQAGVSNTLEFLLREIKYLLKLRVRVYAVLFNDSVTKASDRIKLDIPDAFWSTIEQAEPIIAPLAESAEFLGREDTPTRSSVFLLLVKLIKEYIKVAESDTSCSFKSIYMKPFSLAIAPSLNIYRTEQIILVKVYLCL